MGLTRAKNVCAIVPIHNGLPHVLDCLNSLTNQVSDVFTISIVVVDDGSTDESVQLIQDKFPRVFILKGNGDLWWTGAMKIGIDYALGQGADYIFWINHDDTLMPGSIERLVAHQQVNPMVIPCCSVVAKNSSSRALCGYKLDFLKWYIQPVLVDIELAKEKTFVREADLNGGHGILISADIFRKFPDVLRPEWFPHYAGDFDFFFGIRRHGYKVETIGGAVIFNDSMNSGLQGFSSKNVFLESWTGLTSRRSVVNVRDRPLLALLNFPLGFNLLWTLILFVSSFVSVLAPFRKKRVAI